MSKKEPEKLKKGNLRELEKRIDGVIYDKETKKPEKLTYPPDRPELKPLTVKQRVFVAHYTNTSNPKTLGNATESTVQSYNYKNRETARAQGSTLLAEPNVRYNVETILEEIDLNPKVRLGIIGQIAKGVTESKTVTSGITYDNDGNPHEYSSTTTRDPTPRDRLQAINLIEKITGTYDKNRVKADAMSADLKQLIKHHKFQYHSDASNHERTVSSNDE